MKDFDTLDVQYEQCIKDALQIYILNTKTEKLINLQFGTKN